MGRFISRLNTDGKIIEGCKLRRNLPKYGRDYKG